MSSDGDHFIERFVLVHPHLLALYAESWLEKKRLKEMRWDWQEATLAAVILASGVWMIIEGLMKLWGE
jgi:hypothetical protein